MKSISFLSHAINETQEWGELFGKELAIPSIIAFYGPLGAGKTTLVKAMIDGITEGKVVISTSPTFVYLNEYHGAHPSIYHFDLYRLQESEDFVECGFEDYFYQDGICLIEWAERIENLLPLHTLRLRLKHINETTREITLE